MEPHTNRLANETSPYLLQHAHNPVDWYPWGDEAFERARAEAKPVLVSIGYAACHWCHVMERESFEDPEVAKLMNERFINIKVDREERPDVDGVYMDAVQAISGSGGWPLNVFVTPDRKPFYGGTYFPPQRAFNRASWTEVLLAISEAFTARRGEIEEQATALTGHIEAGGSQFLGTEGDGAQGEGAIHSAYGAIMKTADRTWGGFGRAPKFPQTLTISFLFAYAEAYKNSEARAQALLTLNKMIQGGIYDQIGGGFSRYSTDEEWLVPHFEKMLYDNALLAGVISEAFAITGEARYRKALEETLAFTERELMHPEGGFYSALDADSEGEEGRFYVWTHEEVKESLGPDAEVFCQYYDISPEGNWEGKNIARVRTPLEEFAARLRRPASEIDDLLGRGREVLLQKRDGRVRPGLDDKLLLGWNALMNTAFSKAYAVTGDPRYLQTAKRNMEFLLQAFAAPEGGFHHTWKEGRARYPAFLDDYAFLIAALIELAQVSADYALFDRAAVLAEKVLEAFSDPGSPLLFYTPEGGQDVPVRKKEFYDGATPSGNAVMAGNLYRLSIVFDRMEWRERAEAMVRTLESAVVAYPTSFGAWLSLLFELVRGTREIAIIGPEWENYLQKINRIHISHKLAMASRRPLDHYPLLAEKAETDLTLVFLCKNYSCQQPVTTVEQLVSMLF